jgi:hypothetical protein
MLPPTPPPRPEIFESGFSRVSIKENFGIFEKINFFQVFLEANFFSKLVYVNKTFLSVKI